MDVIPHLVHRRAPEIRAGFRPVAESGAPPDALGLGTLDTRALMTVATSSLSASIAGNRALRGCQMPVMSAQVTPVEMPAEAMGRITHAAYRRAALPVGPLRFLDD